MCFDASTASQKLFVADPPDGARHNRGSATGLDLRDLETGEPTDMTGTHDGFSRRPFPNCRGGTSRERWLRELLRRVVEAGWRHFDQGDRREYALRNATVGQLGRR